LGHAPRGELFKRGNQVPRTIVDSDRSPQQFAGAWLRAESGYPFAQEYLAAARGDLLSWGLFYVQPGYRWHQLVGAHFDIHCQADAIIVSSC
jgi:hypothetical protein